MAENNAEDRGFEVVDKRMRDEEASEPETTKETEDTSPEEETEGEPAGDVYSLIQWTVLMLAEGAWYWMGLRINPATKKAQEDMLQAKIAIDSVVFLVDKIAPHLEEEQKKEYRRMVSDLQVNYVQKSSAG